MTDEQKVLSRRAVACPKWRLMPGMLTDEGRRVMHVWPDDLGIHWSHIPDFLAALLRMVEKGEHHLPENNNLE